MTISGRVSLFVAFAMGAAAALLVQPGLRIQAQAQPNDLLRRVKVLEDRLSALENSPTRSGSPAAAVAGQSSTYAGQPPMSGGHAGTGVSLSQLSSQVAVLQSRVQTLQAQLMNHTHTYYQPHLVSMAILHCPGIGQPCTSATGFKEIDVLMDAAVVSRGTKPSIEGLTGLPVFANPSNPQASQGSTTSPIQNLGGALQHQGSGTNPGQTVGGALQHR